MGIGALAAPQIITTRSVMTQVLGILVLIVLHSLLFGAACASFERASQAVWPIRRESRPSTERDPGRAELLQERRERALRQRHRERLRYRHQAHARALVLVAFD